MNKNNKIPHLRICVTEECENRCLYCRPGGEACRTTNEREMSIKHIFYSVNLLAKHGISHLKITGGEPLLRSDILKLIKLIGSIEGIEDIELITRSPNCSVHRHATESFILEPLLILQIKQVSKHGFAI